MSAPNDVILYAYRASPYAKKIANYLAFRGIDYAMCTQPPVLPREDLSMLGVRYRRIPLLAIGRDVYADTRLIVRKLEERFPDGAIASRDPTFRAIERLVERWVGDAGVFARAAALIPAEMPLMKDPTFLKDRSALTGQPWSAEAQARRRPEALAHMADAFELLQSTLLAKSQWIEGGPQPTLADVEAAFVFEWLMGMPGALPKSWQTKYARVYEWVARLGAVVKSRYKKPVALSGAQARDLVLAAAAGDASNGDVDPEDPSGLKGGDAAQLHPIDSGFSHKDVGRLVTLNASEVAIEVETPSAGRTVVLHAPRWGFRVTRAGSGSKI